MRSSSAASGLVLFTLVACACGAQPSAPRSSRPSPPATSVASPSPSPSPSPAAPSATARTEPDPVTRPTGMLTTADARRYMLRLVNRDRASRDLPPVELDEGPAATAGQGHAEDMVRLGYLGHWGSDGSVPEQRHTEAGGADMVLENALCFTDEVKRVADPSPRIDPAQVERAEAMFFDEVPPNDGHRRNILKPLHTRVGIGIAQSTETARELAVPCFAQEFVDGYGTYEPLPRTSKVGARVHVAGALAGGVRPTGVGVARVGTPKPLAAKDLNQRRTYPVPKPYQMYWGPGFVTPITLRIDGERFAIDVPLSEGGQAGLYEVSVWAKVGASDEQAMVGLRTVRVE